MSTETVPQEQWIYWDLGFLVWGALMLIGSSSGLLHPSLAEWSRTRV